jgi:hypothetical protein
MFEDVQMCVSLAARLHFGFALSKDLNREQRSIWVIISRTKPGANNCTTTTMIRNTHRTTHVRLHSERSILVIISRTKPGANNLTTTMTIINTHRTTQRTTQRTTHVRLQSEPKLKFNFKLQLHQHQQLQLQLQKQS